MTGAELIKWIRDNDAEDWTVIVTGQNIRYSTVEFIWEGETDGHAIMLDCKERK